MKLFNSIHRCHRLCWYAVPQNHSVTALEEYAKPAPEVAECLLFLLARVAGHGRLKLPHLYLRHCVPATEGLSPHGQESAALLPAILLGFSPLPVIGEIETVAEGGGGLLNCGHLEGVHHSNTQRSIPPPAKCEIRTSAVRQSSPGIGNRLSLVGPSPAATTVSCRASRRWLWQLILSPPVPHDIAWSARVSLRKEGQGPALGPQVTSEIAESPISQTPLRYCHSL